MKIQVKKVSTVKPAEETPRRVLWSSKLDMLVTRIHLPSVYFYKPPPVNYSGDFFDGSVLKEALSKALVPFYPIAGRLRSNAGDNNIDIDCNGEGVLFVEAEADVSVAHFGEFTPTPELLSLIPRVDCSGGISSLPILVVQVTHFKCGGVCLGMGMHHYVGDGFSCIHFVNTWSDMARGLDLQIPPYIDRTLLRARNPPCPAFDHIEYSPPPPLKTGTPPTENALAAATFKITRDQLNALKLDADTAGAYSSFEALSAHVWRCACMARSLQADQESKLYISTGGRSRLEPPLPVGYFGNVVFSATPIAQAGELLSKPPRFSAALIHDALARMDNEYLRSAIDFVELKPDVSVLTRGPHTYKSPNLGITTWVGMPIHEADFGWGRPVYMGPAACGIEGIVFVLPSPSKGSMSILICLQKQHLKVFQKLLYDI